MERFTNLRVILTRCLLKKLEQLERLIDSNTAIVIRRQGGGGGSGVEDGLERWRREPGPCTLSDNWYASAF